MRKNKRPNLPYLEFKTVKGHTYIYFRRGQIRKRLPDNPDSPEFMEAYSKMRFGHFDHTPTRNWNKLIMAYYQSPRFKKLSRSTQLNYKRHCEEIRMKNGTLAVADFKRKDAIAVQEALQDTWSKANERLAVLSVLCKHAIDLDWITTNPVTGIKKLDGGSYSAWPDDKLEAYEAYCEAHQLTLARTIYELAIGTGQRLGDCIKMRWSDFDGEFMSVVQEKTKIKIDVFCPTRLRNYLQKLPKNGAYILAKNLTEPVGKRQIQKSIEDVRRAIGVFETDYRLVPHGWRYTAAKEMADAGVDTRDIQAVTGHQTLEMALKYTKDADQKAASKRAQIIREQNKTRTRKCET